MEVNKILGVYFLYFAGWTSAPRSRRPISLRIFTVALVWQAAIATAQNKATEVGLRATSELIQTASIGSVFSFLRPRIMNRPAMSKPTWGMSAPSISGTAAQPDEQLAVAKP